MKNIKIRTTKPNPSKRIDWAVEVRKHKPQLNTLTDAERQELFEEGLAMIQGTMKTERHARSR